MTSSKQLCLFCVIVFLSKTGSETSVGLRKSLAERRKDDDIYLSIQGVLDGILKSTLRNVKCVAIFCDAYYQDIFSHAFFMKYRFPPYFKLLVKDNEDLLSPNFHTLQTLRKVRNDGCRLYIIFIANGGQLSRLLKFGDKYRVLNTRARFIFLYDLRLFRPELHYLWKKFINVVFLRRFEGYKMSAADGSYQSIPWFEISTVPFPSPIRGMLIPRRLDTWRSGKFHSGVNLFREKISDLQNQVLQVVTFEHIPSAVQEKHAMVSNNSVVFGGLEIEVLRTIAAKMNFFPQIYEKDRAEKWGKENPNGSFTGLLGEVVSGRAEIALGNLYYTPYHLNLMDLSVPYNTECLTFLTPEILTDNSWKTLILPLKPLMWVAVIVTLLLGGFIFYALSHSQEYLYDTREVTGVSAFRNKGDVSEGFFVFGSISNGILYTYGMLLLVSLPKLPSGWSLRLLTGWYWLYCILVVVAYRASLTAILANPAPRLRIDTLDQLADSHIACGGWREQDKLFFQTSLDDAGKKIGDKFEIVQNDEEAIGRVATGEFAMYGNLHYLRYARIKKEMGLSDSKGNKEDTNSTEKKKSPSEEKSLHIMQDCAINMPISIGLQKNYPLKPQIDKFMYNMIEAGLMKKWLTNVMLPTANLENILQESAASTSALMDLRKLYGALVALGIGYFLSSCILIGEVLHWQLIVKKSPFYDKYALHLYYKKQKTKQRIS